MQSFLSQLPAVLLDTHTHQSVMWYNMCFLPLVITSEQGKMEGSLVSGFVIDKV